MTVHHGGERDAQAPVPNHRLRALRQQRNWSQQEFSEAIRDQAMAMELNLACDEKRVGRWERGEVRWPSPAYRRVLQAVLQVPVAEMGFVAPHETPAPEPEPAPLVSGAPTGPITPLTGVALPALAPQAPAVSRGWGPDFGQPSLAEPMLAGLDDLETMQTLEALEFTRRVEASDVGPATLEGLRLNLDRLCREYSYVDAYHVRGQAAPQLRYVMNLLDGRLTLSHHRELLVLGGRLSALLGCLYYDMGHKEAAQASSEAAFHFGEQAGDRELMAWSYELKAWFALTEHRYTEVTSNALTGQEICPGATHATVQLAVQQAKGASLMGDRRAAEAAMERGRQAMAGLPAGGDPRHHFVFDQTKYSFYAASCYQWLKDHEKAEQYSNEVFDQCEQQDGSLMWPMRYAETKIGQGIIAAARGELEKAVGYGTAGLDIPRKSGPSLMMRAKELMAILTARHPRERQTQEFRERYLTAQEQCGERMAVPV